MRWIDKSKNRADGIQNTLEFLDNHCLDPDGRHAGILYNSPDKKAKEHAFCLADNGRYRKRLTQLLLDDQNDMCCYCLRKLKTNQDEAYSEQKITLEHIIPNSYTSADDVAYYQTAPGLTADDVVLSDIYETPEYRQCREIHPHKVAYNNLVASCNGTFPDKQSKNYGKQKICCNIYRGNSQAYPVYFLNNIDALIDYLSDGDVQAVIGTREESYVATAIANTNIQCDSLKDIRHIWYLLRHTSENEIYACNKNDDKRKYLLSKLLFDADATDLDRSMDLFEKYSKSTYWDTLILYNEFYHIMRAKYPLPT